MRAADSRRWQRFILAATAVFFVLLAYARTIGYGYVWDDYHMVRPSTAADIRHVLMRSWDPTRIEAVFYRPLTALWYALRFELFGVNAALQHAVSIAGMTVAAWLCAWFVWGETHRLRAAVIAAALYALHPGFVTSQAVWLTNQMHLLSSLLVLTSLVVWQRLRSRPWPQWWPLALLQIVAFGFKEDTILLTPVVLAMTMLRAWIVKDVRVPRASAFAAGALLVVGLIAGRYYLLGRMGGYGTPPEERAWFNFKRGLDAIFRLAPGRLTAGDRPWHRAARWIAVPVLGAGVLAAFVRRQRTLVYLALCGAVVGLAFNLPFALVTKPEQLHLVTLGAVLALTAASEALIGAFATPAWFWIGSAAVAGLLVTLVPLDWMIADGFAPCFANTLGLDRDAELWAAVPEDIRAWLVEKRAICDAGREPPSMADGLETVTWTYDTQEIGGERARWTSGHSVTFVRWRSQEIQLSLRQPYATMSAPVTVTVIGPASTTTDTLTSGDGVFHTIVMRPTARDWLRGMHRVDIEVTPTFVPGLRDPAEPDNRRHGVQFRILTVR